MQAAVERVAVAYEEVLASVAHTVDVSSRATYRSAAAREEAISRSLDAFHARIHSFHVACNAVQKASDVARDAVLANSVMDSARGPPMPLPSHFLSSPGVTDMLADMHARQVAASQVASVSAAMMGISEDLQRHGSSGRIQGESQTCKHVAADDPPQQEQA